LYVSVSFLAQKKSTKGIRCGKDHRKTLTVWAIVRVAPRRAERDTCVPMVHRVFRVGNVDRGRVTVGNHYVDLWWFKGRGNWAIHISPQYTDSYTRLVKPPTCPPLPLRGSPGQSDMGEIQLSDIHLSYASLNMDSRL
jgi:hypothetical protein